MQEKDRQALTIYKRKNRHIKPANKSYEGVLKSEGK